MIPETGRSLGEWNSYPVQYSCLESPMDRGPWWAAVHRVAKGQTWLSDWASTLLDKDLSVNFFFFQLFKYIVPLPSAYRVSAEISSNNFTEDTLYVTNHFSFTAFINHFLSFCIWLQYSMCFESLWIYHTFHSLSFLYLYIYVIPKILDFWAIISSNTLSSPFSLPFFFWDSHYACFGLLNGFL